MNYNINRFIEAHEKYYDTALLEIKKGKKINHWMWYIFPQLKGLGTTAMSEYYGIENLEEAKQYYNNELLHSHLIEICSELLKHNTKIGDILGYPDNYKLRSCITLFSIVDEENKIFKVILEKFYDNSMDMSTLTLLNKNNKEVNKYLNKTV